VLSSGCLMPGDYPEHGSGTGTAFHRVSALAFAPLPTAVACARLHAVVVLYEWGLRDLADDTAVIVSELMTNALRASVVLAARPPIALRLLANERRLVIEAWDWCAMRRLDVFPVQPGGTWRSVSGSDGLPESERCREQ
jgi:hypothetical protein